MQQPFVDLHCHPAMKPYGQSFKLTPVGQNTVNRRKKNSIWHYDPPNLFERALQLLCGISKFTQSDCATLAYGNTRIVCASLYPIEKGFFRNDLGTGIVSDLANCFITSVSRQRVDYIQSISNYFDDLVNERNFYLQLSEKVINTDAGSYTYKVVSNYQQIQDHLSRGENISGNTVFIVFTIEGMHAINTLYNEQGDADEAELLARTIEIKQWDHPPFFITFAHHFFNHLCGHARSLTQLVGNMTDQSFGINTGFTPLGHKVLKTLLSQDNGPRIYIDIKHMSAQSRTEYYQVLRDEYPVDKIPVIVSHGACNGLRSAAEPVLDNIETGRKMLQEDINFYDDEIITIAASKGIFGIQLDERRIASAATLKEIKHAIPMNKIRHYRAELVWNQVRHIIELLDSRELFAWDCIAIGSDFDGVINPLNGYLTAETFPHLQEYLERYIHNYMETDGKTILHTYNQVSPSEAVNRIFSSNAMEFMKQWFK